MGHAPLPWSHAMAISGSGHVIKHDDRVLAIKAKPEDAAYIVKACNAYPRLCDVLRELVEAVDEQQDGLDPTVRLVQAMRDAKTWVNP
jgi:hypothetical protein